MNNCKKYVEKIINSYAAGTAPQCAIDEAVHALLHNKKTFAPHVALHARVVDDALMVADAVRLPMALTIDLLGGIHLFWDKLFGDDQTSCFDGSEKGRWFEDVCYEVLKRGWNANFYIRCCISDAGKMFLIARTLKERDDKNGSAGGNKKNSEDSPVTSKARKVVAVKKVAGEAHHQHSKKSLKLYKVSVMRTYYGDVFVSAHNEDEALKIAAGEKKGYDGRWASEQFKPSQHDAYLEINDMGDETVVEIKE